MDRIWKALCCVAHKGTGDGGGQYGRKIGGCHGLEIKPCVLGVVVKQRVQWIISRPRELACDGISIATGLTGDQKKLCGCMYDIHISTTLTSITSEPVGSGSLCRFGIGLPAGTVLRRITHSAESRRAGLRLLTVVLYCCVITQTQHRELHNIDRWRAGKGHGSPHVFVL